MRVVRDLLGGTKPPSIDHAYNAALAADGGTLRYKGSLVAQTLYNDVDNGRFWTFGLSAGATSAMVNFVGLLEEEVPAASGNGYLPNTSSDVEMIRRRITPCFPSTVIEAEYARSDAAGTNNLETNMTGSAAGTALTLGNGTDTDDYNIGQWVYFTNGANAGYLHYVEDSDDSSESLTLPTALVNAVVAADDQIIVNARTTINCLFDATGTGIMSNADSGDMAHTITGMEHFISAPGIPKQPLNRDKHDGQNVGTNARFYHTFTIPKSNLWILGEATS